MGKYYNALLNQKQKEYKDGQSFISPDQFLVSKQISKSDIPQPSAAEPVNVKLVSPVKQANDQVVSELKRESDSDGIKATVRKEINRSMKKRERKSSSKNSKEKKQKNVKRNKIGKKDKKIKKVLKRRIKDIFTL